MMYITTVVCPPRMEIGAFGKLALGGAMFCGQQDVFIMVDYAETRCFVVPPHVSCLWLFFPRCVALLVFVLVLLSSPY